MKNFLTVPQAAKRLGIHEDTVRAHLVHFSKWKKETGKIPFHVLGAYRRIPLWWVKQWEEAGKPPPSEPES